MKRILLLLTIFATTIACEKDDENTQLSPEEQAKVDDEQTIEYMKTHKFEDYYVGDMANNIDWIVVELAEDEPDDTQTLYDLMSENVIETEFGGVDYKMYYFMHDEGTGGNPVDEDHVAVDYNVFLLEGTKTIDNSSFTSFFKLDGLIEGWKVGLKIFNSGTKPDVFPGDSDSPYRELVENPGRGMLLVPSGLAYGSGVLRFDVVLYHNETIEE